MRRTFDETSLFVKVRLFDAYDHVGGLDDGKGGRAFGQAQLVDGVVGDGALDDGAVGKLEGHVAVDGAFLDGAFLNAFDGARELVARGDAGDALDPAANITLVALMTT